MTELAGWLMLALILAVGVLALYAALKPGRPGPKGDTGPCGPMGVMGVPGKPGECRCPTKGQEAVARAVQRRGSMDFRRREEEAAVEVTAYGQFPPGPPTYRAVVYWDARGIIGNGPHRKTLFVAHSDGRSCLEHYGADRYIIQRRVDEDYWVEVARRG